MRINLMGKLLGNKMTSIRFDLKELLGHFSDIGRKRWGILIDHKKLEKIFAPFRKGDAEFSLRHLDLIRKDWGFINFWKLPELSEDDFVCLKGVFVDIGPRDEKVIDLLYDLVKNIEIVSCILRFVDPGNYGIISPPVENILCTRGKHQIEKYINYLNELDILKEEFDFERIADVEMSLWTLANIINNDFFKNDPIYCEIIQSYKQTTNRIKKIMANNSLEKLKNEKPLFKAELFWDSDYELAGIIAGRELEIFIKDKYKTIGGKMKKPGSIFPSFSEQIEKLVNNKIIVKEKKILVSKWWKFRGDLVHDRKPKLSKNDVKKMIEGISILFKNINDEIQKRFGVKS